MPLLSVSQAAISPLDLIRTVAAPREPIIKTACRGPVVIQADINQLIYAANPTTDEELQTFIRQTQHQLLTSYTTPRLANHQLGVDFAQNNTRLAVTHHHHHQPSTYRQEAETPTTQNALFDSVLQGVVLQNAMMYAAAAGAAAASSSSPLFSHFAPPPPPAALLVEHNSPSRLFGLDPNHFPPATAGWQRFTNSTSSPHTPNLDWLLLHSMTHGAAAL